MTGLLAADRRQIGSIAILVVIAVLPVTAAQVMRATLLGEYGTAFMLGLAAMVAAAARLGRSRPVVSRFLHLFLVSVAAVGAARDLSGPGSPSAPTEAVIIAGVLFAFWAAYEASAVAPLRRGSAGRARDDGGW